MKYDLPLHMLCVAIMIDFEITQQVIVCLRFRNDLSGLEQVGKQPSSLYDVCRDNDRFRDRLTGPLSV